MLFCSVYADNTMHAWLMENLPCNVGCDEIKHSTYNSLLVQVYHIVSHNALSIQNESVIMHSSLCTFEKKKDLKRLHSV